MLRQRSPQSRAQEHSRRPRLHSSASSNCHRRRMEALRASSQCASRAPASCAAKPNEVRRYAPSAAFCLLFRNSLEFKATAASPHFWPSSVRGCTQSQHAPARRGLTPPSSRAPTAKRQARATVQCIICSAGLAFFCWCRLMSNVRQRSGNLVASLSSHGNSQPSAACGHRARRQKNPPLRLH